MIDIEERRRRNRERMRQWYKDNPEEARARSKKWAEANRDKVRATSKQYRGANSDKIKARGKQYRDVEREAISARGKEWRDANPEKIKAGRRKYYDATRETRIIRSAEWYEANKERKVEYDKNRRMEIKTKDPDYYKKYNAANRERRKIQSRENRIKFPARHLLHSAKGRAKALNIPFGITIDDIVVPEVCPVLGIPIQVGDGIHCDNSPSIDRINPKLGYTKGNIAVISYRANAIKQNATIEELRAIADWLEKVSR